ncbi:FAD-binding and (Fe-S)-binding domain-containing protein [Variovorax rhizosphaerae]|uniref:FAD-linked oxidase C-terminal domain-containing protein n=1 Tax=Variovorax rhizosphaerae TaxID=1836200 RepID=A0ABU8WTN6_9BURK
MTKLPAPLPNDPKLIDVSALTARLTAALKGEVRFDNGARALYSADASNYRQVPIGVVIPRTTEDLVEAVRICHEFGAPILPRGGGTSMCGQSVNVAVVIDASKYLNHVLDVDPVNRCAHVEPGVICDALRDAAEVFNLTFAPDPSTHSRCTLGGMIGNNSCGPHSVMAGKTEENIEALEILTYDGARFWVGPTSPDELERIIAEGGRRGEIYAGLKALRDRYADEIRSRFPDIRRRVSGYNLNQLLPENGFNVARALVGTEGTCALVLQAKTTLVSSPPVRVLLALGYPDIYLAGDAVPSLMPFKPIALEGVGDGIIEGLRERGLKLDDIALLPNGNGWLLVEFGADSREQATAQAEALREYLQAQPEPPDMRLIVEPVLQQRIWSIRELGTSATQLSDVPSKSDAIVGWEDAAVDPARMGDYLREFQKLIDRYGYKTSLLGHFGDGCVHARIDFDLRTLEGLKTWRAFLTEAAHLVVKYGGSLNGEHGDGQAKAEFLPIMFGERLMQGFREFKEIWDPQHRMNPRNLINPHKIEENLRMGPDYKPRPVKTFFAFADKQGSFNRAVEHCVGMGKCRAKEAGTMCPSYRATGEERYSTRGRSRLLFEMLRGEVITDGWRSEEVKEALSMCLACKGCKSDCPTHVDMATYKAEFLSHYHEHKRRPIQAYSMGMIGSWAGLASALPWLTNFMTQTPGLRSIVKAVSGIAQQRTIARFASQTFRKRFSSREPSVGHRGQVLLWADTFNNYFHPETAMAAVEVLEHAGYEVIIPSVRLCCGRPLYDFGMLDQAKRQLRDILQALSPQISAGIPIVGLEPACVAVFRDEMVNLFPQDACARKMASQTYLLSEFLVKRADYVPPKLDRKALVHGHCHQKAIVGMADEVKLLKAMGLDMDLLDSGCCGMAGSFGFDKKKFDVSVKIGELVLLPEVRAAAQDTLIITNGYSCREQIEQCGDRRALHLAEVLQMAIRASRSVERHHHAEKSEGPVEIW